MKKLLAICLSLILVASFATPVFAYEGTGEVEITAHVPSTYSITIPATMDAYMGSGEVTINGANLEDNYQVDVFVLNVNGVGEIPLTHTNGVDKVICVLRNRELGTINETTPLVSFSAEEMQDTYTKTKYFDMEVLNVGKAGRYSGTMVYAFYCAESL